VSELEVVNAFRRVTHDEFEVQGECSVDHRTALESARRGGAVEVICCDCQIRTTVSTEGKEPCQQPHFLGGALLNFNQ
jgi:hypothetical protein